MNGSIIYRGPSEVDGSPIVAVLTGTRRPSSNRKTGPMAQLWILADEGEKPSEAIKTGGDAGVCGDCKLRGVAGKGRGCYVNLGQAPNAVYRSLAGYSDEPVSGVRFAVRLGAYGDPAALPVDVVAELIRESLFGHTGYSHQWDSIPTGWSHYLMASVDSSEERKRAKGKGYRTFRVTTEDKLEPGEAWCPATEEGGSRTNCDRCQWCSGGTTGPDVVVKAHGAAMKHV